MKIASSPQNRRRLLYSVDRQLQRPTRRVIFPDNRQNVVVVSAFTPLAIQYVVFTYVNIFLVKYASYKSNSSLITIGMSLYFFPYRKR